MKSISWQWTFSLRATPEQLWPFLSNTNQLNYDLGLPAIHALPSSGTSWQGTNRFQFTWWGLPVEWEESPFEWVDGEYFKVLRRYMRGPVEELYVELRLNESSEGSVAHYNIQVQPRSVFYIPAIQIAAVIAKQKLQRVLYHYDEQALNQILPQTVLEKKFSQGSSERLRFFQSELEKKGFKHSQIQHLIALIDEASDLDLAKIRPLKLAKDWKESPREIIELCLEATRLGLLDLKWDLLCPLCRGSKGRFDSLNAVNPKLHCETCQIDFTVSFDRSVELLFQPNPSVRLVQSQDFCMGSPRRTPHVVIQQILNPKETRVILMPEEEGAYRLRFLTQTTQIPLQVQADGEREKIISLDENVSSLSLAPQARLTLKNETGQLQIVILERTMWSDEVLTAAYATTLPMFRDLFAKEVLRRDVEISVGSLTIVFTDLKNSTQMYRTMGDARAFGRVLNHFDLLKEAIEKEEGVVIKTIGDSVMAVFARPICALRAMLAAQRKVGALREAPLQLKAGIHTGACMAVNLNERLDYFGSSVNIAARLGGLSSGVNLITSSNTLKDPEVSAWLKSYPEIEQQRLEARLKGLEEEALEVWALESHK